MKFKNFSIDGKQFLPSQEEKNFLTLKAKEISQFLKKEINKEKLKASVFIGGSFAKNTLIKSEFYDIDLFIRSKNFNEIFLKKIKEILKKFSSEKNYRISEIHGSRDYFKISVKDNLVFEVIPVKWIKNPKEAENSTDLSYAHVNYVKKKIKEKPKLLNEIALLKMFCKAQGIYGAESYIRGFSGYGIECLIINYGSFLNFAKQVVNERGLIILDPEKHYSSQREVLINLNESKLKSPIVLVDPVWKERNILAALSHESFEKFKNAIKKFLSRPSKKFFEIKKPNISDLVKFAKKRGAEILNIEIYTEKQEGDIAGTKLKKFYEFLTEQISKKFILLKKDFEYDGTKKAEVYFVVKPKQEIIMRGPPLSMLKHVSTFKKKYKKVFEKEGRVYAKIKVEKCAKHFLKEFFEKNQKYLNEMDICSAKVI